MRHSHRTASTIQSRVPRRATCQPGPRTLQRIPEKSPEPDRHCDGRRGVKISENVHTALLDRETSMIERAPSSGSSMSRREFGKQAALGAATLALGPSIVVANDNKPAILGGTPVAKTSWPSWPVIGDGERQGVAKVLESGNWYRYSGGKGAVDDFEASWSKALGVAHCQATSSGTTSLITAFAALDLGPGDEVLVPPYTFIATVNAVMVHHALPVFVDSDPATAQIDPAKIAERVTGDTRRVVPVHLGGASCDMDQLLKIAKDQNLAVVEDSCQTHTGEWKGKRLGGFGDAGCYSFQNSKN